jgi:hypothetical protein
MGSHIMTWSAGGGREVTAWRQRVLSAPPARRAHSARHHEEGLSCCTSNGPWATSVAVLSRPRLRSAYRSYAAKAADLRPARRLELRCLEQKYLSRIPSLVGGPYDGPIPHPGAEVCRAAGDDRRTIGASYGFVDGLPRAGTFVPPGFVRVLRPGILLPAAGIDQSSWVVVAR